MLFSESKLLPANIFVEKGARDVLDRGGSRLEFYAEYLDANRFPGESHYRLFREYLQEKYSQRPPDLVMTFLARRFDLAGQLPAELFPKTPVVFAALTDAEIPSTKSSGNVTGVVQRLDVPGALGAILDLQPETQRIVVIAGTAPFDRMMVSLTEEASRALNERVQFDYWTELPVGEMRRDVASLPPRTAIFYTTVFRDAAGETFYPEQVAALLSGSASAPIYVMGDPLIGSGVIGGRVAPLESLGKRAGELAQRVLDGASPASLPVEVRKNGVPMFDWRALKRWGVSESRLPPGSIVRFRPPSVWEQYKGYLVAGLTIIVLQASLIGGLLVQRVRRRRAEQALQRSRDDLAHVTRVATVGELTSSIAHELNQPLGAILSNAEAAEMLLKAEPPALDEVREILADIRADDQRASEVIRGMRRLLRKQELLREPLQINHVVGELLRLLSIDAAHRNALLTFQPADDLPLIRGDRVQLQQAVLNLVVNAMEAMAGLPHEQRQIVVQTARGEAGTIMVSVSDSGRGIPPDKVSKMFETFFTTKKEGMGMGLSIARTIIETHHGRIWAENNPGGGATFHFTLPVAVEA